MGEQPLRILKTEPLESAAVPPPTVGQRVPLSIAKTEALTGRGGGPGTPSAATGGRGGQPGGARAATPPPAPVFYPGGWKAAGQDAAGMAGGIAATALATAALPEVAAVAGLGGGAEALGFNVLPKALSLGSRVLRAGAGIVGAGAGGAAASAVQGDPLTVTNGTGTEDSIAHAFKSQAEMEAMGLGTGWLAGNIGRRMVGSKVAGNAREWLDATRRGHIEDLQRTLEASQEALRTNAETKAMVRLRATNAGGAAKSATRQGALDMQRVAEGWPRTEAEVTPGFALGHQPANTPPPNFGAQATQRVADVVEGPAQRSLDQLGQAVEGAAESGPDIAMAPVKAKLQAMYAKTQPGLSVEAGGVPAAVQAQFGKLPPERVRQILADAGVTLEEEHPLPGVLGKLHDLPDTLPFAEAHKAKRMLDDAINWAPAGAVKSPARGQIKQIVKGVRGQLRDSMNVHAPYAQATAAYKSAAPLFGPQGLARKIQAAATADPDKLVNSLVKVNEPEKFQMLRDVLTEHAAAGGGAEGAEAGQHAWQAVQSTVMYKHLVKPGLENWEASVAKMHPDFKRVLLEDPHARGVFTRLQEMADAFKGIKASTEAEAQGFRDQALDLRREEGRLAVEGQQLKAPKLRAAADLADAKAPTPAERAFKDSSLGRPPEQGFGGRMATRAGAGAGAALGASFGGPIGAGVGAAAGATIGRGIPKGPKVDELIHWASLSPTGTQMVVRALTSPAPGQAIAAAIRLHEWLGAAPPPEMAVGHQQGPAATPPPGPRR